MFSRWRAIEEGLQICVVHAWAICATPHNLDQSEGDPREERSSKQTCSLKRSLK